MSHTFLHISSILMICILIFSLAIPAFAIAPAAIAGAEAISSALLVSSLMGVDYNLTQVEANQLIDFFSAPVNPEYSYWVKALNAGMVTLAIGKEALQGLGILANNAITNYGITDNSSGIAYQYSGYSFRGYPLDYIISNQYNTYYTAGPQDQIVLGSEFGHYYLSFDGNLLDIERTSSTHGNIIWYYQGELVQTQTNVRLPAANTLISFTYYSVDQLNAVRLGYYSGTSPTAIARQTDTVGYKESLNSSIDYTSGTIDTSITSNLPDTAGMEITMPYNDESTIAQLLDALTQFILDNNLELIDYQIVQDVGPPVVTDLTIADAPYSDLDSTLQDILITSNSSKGVLQNIKQWLDTAGSTITDTLTDIKTSVSDLVNEIVDADSNFVSGFISNTMTVFQGWFDQISSHLGIWHHVTTWVGSVSSCLSFFTGILSASGSYYMYPIYALAAGTVVIAVYKRFGR